MFCPNFRKTPKKKRKKKKSNAFPGAPQRFYGPILGIIGPLRAPKIHYFKIKKLTPMILTKLLKNTKEKKIQ